MTAELLKAWAMLAFVFGVAAATWLLVLASAS